MCPCSIRRKASAARSSGNVSHVHRDHALLGEFGEAGQVLDVGVNEAVLAPEADDGVIRDGGEPAAGGEQVGGDLSVAPPIVSKAASTPVGGERGHTVREPVAVLDRLRAEIPQS